jgi:hypothetical protein
LETNWGVFKINSSRFKFESESPPNHPRLAIYFSLSPFSLAKPTKGGNKGVCKIFSGVQEIFKLPFLLVLFSWHRGEGGARCKLSVKPSLPLVVTPATALDPQSSTTTSSATLDRPHPAETAQATPRRPWTSTWPPRASSRTSTPPTTSGPVTSPPTSPSPHRSIPRDAQALDPPCTPPSPRQPDPYWSPGAPRACIAFRRTHVRPHTAPHASLHGTVPQTRRHPRPGPASLRPTPASPVSVAPGLNLRPPRPYRSTTDSHNHISELSVQHRPVQPPVPANHLRRGAR